MTSALTSGFAFFRAMSDFPPGHYTAAPRSRQLKSVSVEPIIIS
jgi:hypothetical protein